MLDLHYLEQVAMNIKHIVSVFFLLSVCAGTRAQFYTSPCEPLSTRWSRMDSGHYRVIYPEGMDSLARVYALCLESAVEPVGSTIGFTPNQMYRKPMPVVLHAYNSVSNGMVVWTPRRMELNTLPEPRALDALPWDVQLSVHESRHVAQLQYTVNRHFRPLYWLTGELASGGLSAVYCGPTFFEGDAVAAETALTESGRGRNAEFLEYYRASFANGDKRDYYRWNYGSLQRFTPDYYKVGYIVNAGVRTLYDTPDFTARYYDRLFRKKLPIRNFQKTIKGISGKSFRKTFAEICDTLDATWRREDAVRGPFMPMEQVCATPRHYTQYRSLCFVGDTLFAWRGGIASPAALVKILPDGTQLRDCWASSLAEGYRSDGQRIWWSENIYDSRWKSIAHSAVRVRETDGSRKSLTEGGYRYNPAPSPDGKEAAVARYTPEGAEYLDVIDATDGTVLRSFRAPDGLQICEPAWLDGHIAVSGITDAGAGIFLADSGFVPLVEPGRFIVKDLFSRDGTVYFTSDRTGVDELYCIGPDRTLRRRSNIRNGASYFQFDADGDTLYFTSVTPDGRLPFKTAVADLPDVVVDPLESHAWPFADKLSDGEPIPFTRKDVPLGEPKHYSRLAGAFNVHSWLPIYLAYDEVGSISSETVYQDVDLGATAYFQSPLSSFYGYAGYHLATYESHFRNAAGAGFVWSSLPVTLAGKFSVGERDALEYGTEHDDVIGEDVEYALSLGHGLVAASLSAYAPLSSSLDGWTRGLIPQLKYEFTNDVHRLDPSRTAPVHKGSASVKAYMIQSTPVSCVYPKLGVGCEMGYDTPFGLSELMSPTSYVSVYGYLPGACELQGLRLAVRYGCKNNFWALGDFSSVSVPEGFGVEAQNHLCFHKNQVNAALDYAIPFWSMDWSGLSPWIYVRNLELHPHASVGVYDSPACSRVEGGMKFTFDGMRETLFSAGLDLNIVLGNLLWLPYETRVGVAYRYKGGSAYDPERDGGRHYIGPSFTVDL